jgi:hypothetical protein
MKQKYVVLLDRDNGKLSIQEYAELDKEMLSLLCEETYAADKIEAAMDQGVGILIQALRTNNMYPPGLYTERIAHAVVDMFQPGANASAELFFEEREMFAAEEESVEKAADDDDEDKSDMDVDDLLDDDDYEKKGLVKNLKKTIKTSDEDTSMADV